MHNIQYYYYDENVDKKKVQADLNEYVSHETWQEGGGGIDPIRWNDFVCDDMESAEKWIKDHDKGWYDCLAVKFKQPKENKTKTAKQTEIEKKLQEAHRTYNERQNAIYPRSRTSEFIGCSKCNSRLATKYLNFNYCPVCHTDLRPETTLKSIAAARAKKEKLEETLKEYIDKHSEKEVRWLVKIEYHT